MQIDGKEYNYDLPADVKHQLLNVNFTDQRIDRVTLQLAIAKDAKAAYIQDLKSVLGGLNAKN